ncbi:type III-B CRISPR module RAMP protein Cmr6 [Streptococcus sp. sy018]|uniref:type III-B CRISPR module RAMP protein Cmr6 n=1 Tax=Streptococcus sp. sy018 TaxID=2600147 RepID=UPI0011B85AC6|nr:type III-B CRISPR module RAMP protein Cmr6 [Streptococcus sp. sy018]TWS95559.1 type III-B CRISPR module RAMP protein Cmr6 [Streptococcus sp. sy018]
MTHNQTNVRNQQNGRTQGKKGNNTFFSFDSSNMSYIFYHEYFEEKKDIDFTQKNKALEHFNQFDYSSSPVISWRQLDHYLCLTLKTVYPGLLIGTGYPHILNEKGVIKAGFSFDYVTGLPYVPGSSLKGLLRHYFPKHHTDSIKIDYIKSALPSLNQEEILELVDLIFEGKDVFLGAFPSDKNKEKKILAQEYITPHRSPIKNPIPINLLKVKDDVFFEFGFMLKDSYLSSDKIVTAKDKLTIFQMILIDMGIGSKTNTGFGRLEK